jgi:spore maturation protein CgeB
VRLFEAGACAVPVVSDPWPGLDTFFSPGAEILVAHTGNDVVDLIGTTDAPARALIGQAARRRVLADHTAERRAAQLEALLMGANVTTAGP